MHIIGREPVFSSLRFHFQIFITAFNLSSSCVLFAKQCEIENSFRTTIVINQVSVQKYLFFVFCFYDISDQFGDFACPLYQDGLPDDQQECIYYWRSIWTILKSCSICSSVEIRWDYFILSCTSTHRSDDDHKSKYSFCFQEYWSMRIKQRQISLSSFIWASIQYLFLL